MTLADSQIFAPSIHRMTVKEFLQMDETGGLELDDGIIEEMAVGNRANWVAGELYSYVRGFVRDNRLGWTFPTETTYTCWPDHARRLRKPDGSFIRFGRVADEKLPEGPFKIAPDLVIEVISSRDVAFKVEKKNREYLDAGVKLIWVIYPETRTAQVHRLDGQASDLSAGDFLDGENVLPGFRLKLGDIFPVEPVALIPPEIQPG